MPEWIYKLFPWLRPPQPPAPLNYDAIVAELRVAMRQRKLGEVERLAALAAKARGDQAGLPQRPDQWHAVPASVKLLSATERAGAFESWRQEIGARKWWATGENPRQATVPLRNAASVVKGCVYAIRAGCYHATSLRALAVDAGEYLLWTQRQAGTGVFPFPARRGGGNPAFDAADDFLRRAEAAGKLPQVLSNGWICDDLGEGHLQFDNAECAVALLELHKLLGDSTSPFLAGAAAAQDWAADRPPVVNWNYNSFAVWLMAEVAGYSPVFARTEEAVSLARLGVYPGQLRDGPRAGRWLDGHNAQPEYHFIILRSLLALARVATGSEQQRALNAAKGAYAARQADVTGRRVVNVESALESLLMLGERTPALSTLETLAVSRYRAGQQPCSPGVWGRYLAWAASQ